MEMTEATLKERVVIFHDQADTVIAAAREIYPMQFHLSFGR